MITEPTKFYIASNFAHRDWLRNNVWPVIELKGHKLIANWITDDVPLPMGREAAKQCIDNIIDADIIIFNSAQFGDTPGKGKYFEFGLTHGKGKNIILIGNQRDCVFNYLIENYYPTFEDFCIELPDFSGPFFDQYGKKDYLL